MGNSEVGHLNIGAGRVVMQELPRIGRAVADGSLAQAPAMRRLIDTCAARGGACHLLGLVSPGGVHAHQDHAVALARIVAGQGIPVRVHAFTDGRDTPPRSAAEYVATLEAALPPGAAIATVCGRYYALDRDNRWDRVSRAFAAIADGEGRRFPTAAAAIAAAYAAGRHRRVRHPAAIGDYAGMAEGDGLLSFNFRADRIRELLAALLDPAFTGFARHAPTLRGRRRHDPLQRRAGAADGRDVPAACDGAILGEAVSRGRQAAAPHGGDREIPARHLLPERRPREPVRGRGADHGALPQGRDLRPAAGDERARADRAAVEAIGTGQFDLVVLNFANPDMVGHTGSLPAAIAAVEAVDAGLGAIADAVAAQGGALLVTADHGNCRADARSGHRRAAHGPHDQSRARAAGGRRAPAAGRPPGRPGADHAGADGPAAAGRDDRTIIAHTIGSSSPAAEEAALTQAAHAHNRAD